MYINSLSTAGIAASVWSNAARTITSDPATDAGAATLVWNHATKTLTADPTVFTSNRAIGSLAASTILDLRPASGYCQYSTGADNNNVFPGYYDGTTFTVVAGTNPGPQTYVCFGSATAASCLKNTDAGAAHNAWHSGYTRG